MLYISHTDLLDWAVYVNDDKNISHRLTEYFVAQSEAEFYRKRIEKQFAEERKAYEQKMKEFWATEVHTQKLIKQMTKKANVKTIPMTYFDHRESVALDMLKLKEQEKNA